MKNIKEMDLMKKLNGKPEGLNEEKLEKVTGGILRRKRRYWGEQSLDETQLTEVSGGAQILIGSHSTHGQDPIDPRLPGLYPWGREDGSRAMV